MDLRDYKPEEVLEKFGRNISKLVKDNKLDPVIGRDDEIRDVIRILSRKTKSNPVLIGEPGVGKTAIAEGLAHRIFRNDVPENLKDKEIVEISLSDIVAGAAVQGQFEQRLNDLINTVEKAEGKYILFIDEIHQLVGAGKTQGAMDAANILKPIMARGSVKIIGATTLNEYRQYIEKDSALERRMQKVMVEEPSIQDAITILRGLKENWETYHGVKIYDEAILGAVKLSHRYITDRFLPDKAIDVIDEACSQIKVEINSVPLELDQVQRKLVNFKMNKIALESDNKKGKELDDLNKKIEVEENNLKELKDTWNAEKKELNKKQELVAKIKQFKEQAQLEKEMGNYEKSGEILYSKLPKLEKELSEFEDLNASLLKNSVGRHEVIKVISRWKDIPIEDLTTDEKAKVVNLANNLEKDVVGQDKAIDAITNTITINKAGLSDETKPIGSFLFLGPTGVGKTELTKSIAKNLFDNENKLIRFDMSEYMEKHAVSRLIGSPPGYVGYDEGGQLTEFVRRNPYSIILFDEIEKAHPDVLNILLQVLDDGSLTDSLKNRVNFKNTIIVMTSNIGQRSILDGNKDEAINELKQYLRPEFINRIDEVVCFNPLSEKLYEKILEKEIMILNRRLLDKNITITIDANAKKQIIKESFDELYGARPLKRYIKSNIEKLLSLAIVSGEIKNNQEVNIKYKDGKYII